MATVQDGDHEEFHGLQNSDLRGDQLFVDVHVHELDCLQQLRQDLPADRLVVLEAPVRVLLAEQGVVDELEEKNDPFFCQKNTVDDLDLQLAELRRVHHCLGEHLKVVR